MYRNLLDINMVPLNGAKYLIGRSVDHQVVAVGVRGLRVRCKPVIDRGRS